MITLKNVYITNTQCAANKPCKTGFQPKNNYFSDDSFYPAFKGSNKAFSYAKKTKYINKLLGRKFYDLNFNKLEGIQEGLKTFEGLSLKQIAFAFTDLHSINLISGCKNHCLHCYANAQPFIKRYPYEDLLQICNDVKELRKRLGINPAHHHGTPYIDCSFDADALECHLFDKNGNKHDFVEIAQLMKDGLGYRPVFDTNGWKCCDEEKQSRAEEYVKKLMHNKNYENFYQINISINPFRPEYVRAINSGYSPNELYSPIKKIGYEADQEEAQLSDDYKKARNLYTQYVKDVANVLMTFKPLLQTKNFSVIIRALDNDIKEMHGFRTDDFAQTLQHIVQELSFKTYFGMLSENELQSFAKLLGNVDTRVFTSGRMEKFYKTKNPTSFDMINRIDLDREKAEARYNNIREKRKNSAAEMRYLKMISPDGKVYMYDNYSIIPTDIRLKTSTEELKRPFRIPMRDFELKTDMIDLI